MDNFTPEPARKSHQSFAGSCSVTDPAPDRTGNHDHLCEAYQADTSAAGNVSADRSPPLLVETWPIGRLGLDTPEDVRLQIYQAVIDADEGDHEGEASGEDEADAVLIWFERLGLQGVR